MIRSLVVLKFLFIFTILPSASSANVCPAAFGQAAERLGQTGRISLNEVSQLQEVGAHLAQAYSDILQIRGADPSGITQVDMPWEQDAWANARFFVSQNATQLSILTRPSEIGRDVIVPASYLVDGQLSAAEVASVITDSSPSAELAEAQPAPPPVSVNTLTDSVPSPSNSTAEEVAEVVSDETAARRATRRPPLRGDHDPRFTARFIKRLRTLLRSLRDSSIPPHAKPAFAEADTTKEHSLIPFRLKSLHQTLMALTGREARELTEQSGIDRALYYNALRVRNDKIFEGSYPDQVLTFFEAQLASFIDQPYSRSRLNATAVLTLNKLITSEKYGEANADLRAQLKKLQTDVSELRPMDSVALGRLIRDYFQLSPTQMDLLFGSTSITWSDGLALGRIGPSNTLIDHLIPVLELLATPRGEQLLKQVRSNEYPRALQARLDALAESSGLYTNEEFFNEWTAVGDGDFKGKLRVLHKFVAQNRPGRLIQFALLEEFGRTNGLTSQGIFYSYTSPESPYFPSVFMWDALIRHFQSYSQNGP